MIQKFFEDGIVASRENGDYKPLNDDEFHQKRREIQQSLEVEHGNVRLLSQQMGEAFIETQTAVKSVDNGANQQVYIDLIVKRIEDKALRIFDLEALLLELDLRFRPIEEEFLDEIISGTYNQDSIKGKFDDESRAIS